MNYRHAFHAGGFADVFKHAVLARILVHLRAKPAAFRVVDTHAGAGLYDLAGPDASRSLEWQRGIQRLLTTRASEDLHTLLAPYLDAVAAANAAGRLSHYPGSPAIARALMRPQDRLIACEIDPKAAADLTRRFAGDRRIKTIAIDGWTALNAYVPPPERRGLVLVDPPFEREDEFARAAQALMAAHRKWPTGTYMLWYPIKTRSQPQALARRLARSGIRKTLRVELEVGAIDSAAPLAGCGLILINPPWALEAELESLLPRLAAILAAPEKGAHHIKWLAGEA
jgi:23S rRNA (adenine2030-N6)-methyltransferase